MDVAVDSKGLSVGSTCSARLAYLSKSNGQVGPLVDQTRHHLPHLKKRLSNISQSTLPFLRNRDAPISCAVHWRFYPNMLTMCIRINFNDLASVHGVDDAHARSGYLGVV